MPLPPSYSLPVGISPCWPYPSVASGTRLQDPEEDAHAAQNANDVRPERPQRLSKLLLLAMFAYAASHLDPTENAAGDVGDPANEYSRRARVILDAVYHESRSATVQALILLGIREFGIGACLVCCA